MEMKHWLGDADIRSLQHPEAAICPRQAFRSTNLTYLLSSFDTMFSDHESKHFITQTLTRSCGRRRSRCDFCREAPENDDCESISRGRHKGGVNGQSESLAWVAGVRWSS